jgi:hypothetical protein
LAVAAHSADQSDAEKAANIEMTRLGSDAKFDICMIVSVILYSSLLCSIGAHRNIHNFGLLRHVFVYSNGNSRLSPLR